MLYITLQVMPGKRDEFVQTARQWIALVRNEEGFGKASLYQDVDDPDGFSLVEKWATQEDLDRHVISGQFAVLVGALKVLCTRSEVAYDLAGRPGRIVVIQS